MLDKNYYDVLGVSRNASDKEIKNAFRALSKKYHPDISKEPDAEDKFKEINEAYSVLSDPRKKEMYDRYGIADEAEIQQEDPFDGFPFGDFFGKARRQGNTRVVERGDDIKIDVNISFEEMFYGTHKKISVSKLCTCHRCSGSGSETNETEPCPRCHGTGMFYETIRQGNSIIERRYPCPHCHGTGQIIKDQCENCHGTGLESGTSDVEFDIPSGMPNNGYFVIKGKGNDGPHRGVPGNLIVVVHCEESQFGLYRDGCDLRYNLKMKFPDMVFGADVEIPYVRGKKKIHIEAGTESGKEIRMYGMGFDDPNNPGDTRFKGDYIIRVDCEIPKKKDLKKEDIETLKKLFK